MRVQRFFTLALLIGLALTAVLLINSSLAATSSAAVSSVAPDWVFQSLVQGSELGYSVGTAGDVNGDGYDDVIVGAPLYIDNVERVGAAFVFYGSDTGLSTTPALTITGGQKGSRFGASVGAAGDVNGDGYADVIVGAPEYGQPAVGRAYV
ncbi:MAG: integrin alpha, partial [Chloroflexi bacterium]|nr:integrin alpha [Chloroflexota bacterium]